MSHKIEVLCHFNKKRSQSVKAIELVSPDVQKSVICFHRSLPGYHPTPLTRLTQLAKYLGIGDLWVKNEAFRFDLEKGWVLLQDTSWPGNEEIPTNIMQGYITLLTEAFQQLDGKWPSHVFMQAGVRSLAAALQAFLCGCHDKPRPFFTVVEPTEAACFYKSMIMADGKPHAVKGDMNTIMAGLACGEPSEIAWDILKKNADAFIACSDHVALKGMRVLGNPLEGDDRIISGESGAVTTGLVYELLNNSMFNELAEQLGLGADSRVLAISTEGDTDPEHYRKVVW